MFKAAAEYGAFGAWGAGCAAPREPGRHVRASCSALPVTGCSAPLVVIELAMARKTFLGRAQICAKCAQYNGFQKQKQAKQRKSKAKQCSAMLVA